MLVVNCRVVDDACCGPCRWLLVFVGIALFDVCCCCGCLWSCLIVLRSCSIAVVGGWLLLFGLVVVVACRVLSVVLFIIT